MTLLIPDEPRPLMCAFETTLACNAGCRHCGSAAGSARKQELSTEEARGLMSALARLGCRKVTLSGGEPLLRQDWPELAQTVRELGMAVELITNGIEVGRQVERIAEAGFRSVSFSVDGPEPVHDELRGVPGCLRELLRGARELKARGVRIGAVTQINRDNLHHLEAIHDLLVKEGFDGWQVQLTTPHGRAKEVDGLCLSPEDLPELEKTLLALALKEAIFLQAADTIGYMSAGEPRLRGGKASRKRFWGSCQAGLRLVGVTSDGTVRGCLSMSENFNEGNIRERSFEEIWSDPDGFAYNRQFDKTQLQAGCKECAFGNVCRAGCTNLAMAATGSIYNNPYCLKRVGG